MIWYGLIFVGLLLLIYFLLRSFELASPADWGSRKLNRITGFISLFCRYLHRFQFDLLPLPEKGSALVASNHISGLDPFLLIAASPRPLRFLIAREEYERFGFNWLFRLAKCIPVDRQGRPERALREALTALEQGDVVAVFPHGKIHLDTDPPRKLRGGVAFLAQKADSDIYPVRVDDVRGAGYTALALFIPGSASLIAFPSLNCVGQEHGDCLTRLTSVLDSGSGVENASDKTKNQ
jgi:1-acyl-sn-glycerol-3-phosphate acyltransferase